MQEDGFDNPRMRAQGLSLSSTSGTRASQANGNKMGSTSVNDGTTRQNNQSLNASGSASHNSLDNRSSDINTISKGGDHVSSQGINQQGTFQSHESIQTNRRTESVGSGFNNSDRSHDNSAFQENNSNQSSRGNKTENGSNVQGNQRGQSSQGNGTFSNSRRSSSGNSSSGNKSSNQNKTNRSNGGGGHFGNGGRSNNSGGSNRSNGGGGSNPRSRGGGR